MAIMPAPIRGEAVVRAAQESIKQFIIDNQLGPGASLPTEHTLARTLGISRNSLREALRVVRPGGRVVIVDYHGPSPLNPWRYLMRPVLSWLEPYALDLWRNPITAFLPGSVDPSSVRTELYFGGLYQKTIIQLPA